MPNEHLWSQKNTSGFVFMWFLSLCYVTVPHTPLDWQGRRGLAAVPIHITKVWGREAGLPSALLRRTDRAFVQMEKSAFLKSGKLSLGISEEVDAIQQEYSQGGFDLN